MGIILKIETKRTFEQLPSLLESMRRRFFSKRKGRRL
jgi:hypothetical protein